MGSRSRADAGRCLRWLVGAAALLAALAPSSSPAAQAEEPLYDELGTVGQFERDVRRARSFREHLQLRLRTGSSFTIDSDFGVFEATRYSPGAGLRLTVPVASDVALRLQVSGGAVLYDFEGAAGGSFGSPTGEPFDDLYDTAFRLQAGYRFPGTRTVFSERERWSLLGEGFARSRWERGASMGSGTVGGGALGLAYQVDDKLEILGGVALSSRKLKPGVQVSPVFEFKWQIAERWTLRSLGRGARLQYRLRDDLALFTSATLWSRTYRLASRPGQGQGEIRERRVPVAVGLSWRVSELVEANLSAGVMAYQQLKIKDSSRETIATAEADLAPFVEFRFDLSP